MTHEATIAKTRAIHRVLDEAAPLIAKYPEIVAVYAEPTTLDSWEARYELADGQTGYGKHFANPETRAKLRGVRKEAGAIRFEAREVAEWPKTKARLTEHMNLVSASYPYHGYSCTVQHPNCMPLALLGTDARNWSEASESAIARGLCLYREQLRDAGHDCDEFNERCKVCGKGMSEIAKSEPVAKRDVELVWVLPTVACELPMGIRFRGAGGAEHTVCGFAGSPVRFVPGERYNVKVSGNDAYAAAAIAFPESVKGRVKCAACGKKDPAFKRLVGGVMAYQCCGSCGGESEAEFLAMALGLVGAKLEAATIMGVKVPPANRFAEAMMRGIEAAKRKADEWIDIGVKAEGPNLTQTGITVRKMTALEIYERRSDGTMPRYTASNLAREAELAEMQAASDHVTGKRAALVAKLGAELRQTVEPRYPHEGRSDRALPIANGVKRWL